MQVNISGHQMTVTEALKNYIMKKMTRLEGHHDNITNVQITLALKKTSHFAECSLHIRGKNIFASSNNNDMYAAIDLLVDKLDRQLLKYKEKKLNHHPHHQNNHHNIDINDNEPDLE